MASILKVDQINDRTNNNTAIEVDSSGLVTTPKVPAFSVYGSAGWVQISSGNDAYFNFTTKDFDNGNNFDVSTDLFTAPVAGYYNFTTQFYARLQTASRGDNNNYYGVRFWVNGSIVGRTSLYGYQNSGDQDRTDVLNQIVSLSANDTVGVRVYANVGDMEYYGTHCGFSGFLVG